VASEGENDITKMAVILSLSKDNGQRPLRASLRQAQTDRPTHLKIQYVIGSITNDLLVMPLRRDSTRADASLLSRISYKTEVVLNLFQDPTGPVDRMKYT
jgi:hypothetical protein